MTEWGAVPVLEIYRQMAVRMQKAADFEQALWWARRGIAVYGEDAARPEAVDDLRRRVAVYAARLAPAAQRSRAHLSPGKPQTETLTCSECRRDFQRVRVRGRKPTRCPECARERIYCKPLAGDSASCVTRPRILHDAHQDHASRVAKRRSRSETRRAKWGHIDPVQVKARLRRAGSLPQDHGPARSRPAQRGTHPEPVGRPSAVTGRLSG